MRPACRCLHNNIFIKFTNHDFFSVKLNRLDVLRSSATCVFGLKCKINCTVLTFSWQHPVRWIVKCGSSFAINWCNITGLTYCNTCNTYCEYFVNKLFRRLVINSIPSPQPIFPGHLNPALWQMNLCPVILRHFAIVLPFHSPLTTYFRQRTKRNTRQLNWGKLSLPRSVLELAERSSGEFSFWQNLPLVGDFLVSAATC